MGSVSIRKLFLRVNNDLSRKDKAGYSSDEEFNRDVEECQTLLMEYHYNNFEENQGTLDALEPFIKEVLLPINNQFCEFPLDYRHKLEAGYVISTNQKDIDCKVGNPTQEPKDMRHLNANEVKKTLTSPIRNPTLKNGLFAYTFVNHKIKVFPKDLVGHISWKYLMDPPAGFYATTVNNVTEELDFDAAKSIDLEWNEQQQPELVDLLLFFKGLQIRESLLITWVKQKNR